MLRQGARIKSRQLASNQPSTLQAGPARPSRVNKKTYPGFTNNAIGTTRSKNRKGTLPVVSVAPKDPCLALPIEIWHYILSFLPLSVIAKIAVVSKTWLEGTGSHPFWKKASNKGGLGEPDDVFKSWMSLVCANSYWVCEACLSTSKGETRLSHIPLPIDVSKVRDDTWMLCYGCRLNYI
ncbi:MAG: hypothetical protein J3R72DRAFT_449727 [Linnemannia gamsii]|nr:MAG: hypothetical protein J3R72DRAFT_449727 [Linnemannia gamsii]